MNAQGASFLAKCTPELAAELLQARECLAGLVPRGFELVYDNYNALVFGFSPTERARDAVLSVAGHPKWVTLFFLKGAALRDPDALLKGSGRTVRSIGLSSPATLQTAAVRALIAQELAAYSPAFRAAPPLRTVVKSVSVKQRPRRPAGSAAKASKPRKVVSAE
jgi:hypothetical protein